MNWFFTKMHGNGNDFIVFDGVRQKIFMNVKVAKIIADRNFGIGSDQILIVERSKNSKADFKYRIFNSDGNEIEHCGNGARCFAKFIFSKGLINKSTLRAQISTGIILIKKSKKNKINVSIGNFSFNNNDINFNISKLKHINSYKCNIWKFYLKLDYLEKYISWLSNISISNPHIVQKVKRIKNLNVTLIGKILSNDLRFKKNVNVNFIQIIDRNNIILRVYERGVGETMSCGTGACASVITCVRRGLLNLNVNVKTKGGIINIIFKNKKLKIEGFANSVFDGLIKIK